MILATPSKKEEETSSRTQDTIPAPVSDALARIDPDEFRRQPSSATERFRGIRPGGLKTALRDRVRWSEQSGPSAVRWPNECRGLTVRSPRCSRGAPGRNAACRLRQPGPAQCNRW
jgi:hypothetical protein